MALIKCTECKKEISDKAGTCPGCGAPVGQAKKKSGVGLFGWLLVLGFGFFVFRCTSSTDMAKPPSQIEAEKRAASAPAAPPPPIQRSPEVSKEIARLKAMDQTAFCTRELSKIKKLKGAWPQPWGEAVTAVMADHGVTPEHVGHIEKGSAVIGMSPCGGLAGWGKPQEVNRSTYSFGTKEQWVYGGRNYLYFTNNKLDSIQN